MNNIFICLGAVRLIVRLLHCLITTINNCYCLVGSILYLVGLCINCVTKELNFPESSMKYAVPGTRIHFFARPWNSVVTFSLVFRGWFRAWSLALLMFFFCISQLLKDYLAKPLRFPVIVIIYRQG